jgi:hypothetical protein
MRTRILSAAVLGIALGTLALMPSTGHAQVVVVSPQPTVSYYYAPAPAPAVSYYYAPTPAPAVSYYYAPAPAVSYYAPRAVYYGAAPVAVTVTPRLLRPYRPRVTYWY